MNFEWKIKSLNYKVSENSLSNIVDCLDLIYIATHEINGISYSAEIETYLNLPDPDSNSFVPFEEVTYLMVCEWIETSFGEGEMLNLQAKLTKMITEMAAPSIVTIVNPFN